MAAEQIIVCPSHGLSKALTQGNSQAPAFASLTLTQAAPSADGVYPFGKGGAFAPTRLFLMPYCEGVAGQQFSLRLYGWRPLDQPSGMPQTAVWIPYFLAELACTACNQPGPTPGGPPPWDNLTGALNPLILPGETFCDTITLTQGNLGPSGAIYSTGPGTDLIAFALVEMLGCKMFQFDFQQTDTVNMNCLWARC